MLLVPKSALKKHNARSHQHFKLYAHAAAFASRHLQHSLLQGTLVTLKIPSSCSFLIVFLPSSEILKQKTTGCPKYIRYIASPSSLQVTSQSHSHDSSIDSLTRHATFAARVSQRTRSLVGIVEGGRPATPARRFPPERRIRPLPRPGSTGRPPRTAEARRQRGGTGAQQHDGARRVTRCRRRAWCMLRARPSHRTAAPCASGDRPASAPRRPRRRRSAAPARRGGRAQHRGGRSERPGRPGR